MGGHRPPDPRHGSINSRPRQPPVTMHRNGSRRDEPDDRLALEHKRHQHCLALTKRSLERIQGDGSRLHEPLILGERLIQFGGRSGQRLAPLAQLCLERGLDARPRPRQAVTPHLLKVGDALERVLPLADHLTEPVVPHREPGSHLLHREARDGGERELGGFKRFGLRVGRQRQNQRSMRAEKIMRTPGLEGA
jgi:hypothetical protein